MYEWTLCLNGYLLYGRTWDEFKECCQILSDSLWLDPSSRRLVIYVHNLAYEFQWIKDLFFWEEIFCTDLRKPLYALSYQGIEFRCSYLLSGVSLAKMGNDLRDFPVQKLVGDLDYNLIRHSQTPLTDQELAYCRNDVLVVCSYIYEQIQQYRSIAKIPLTKTGKVREYCRNACLYDSNTQHKYGAKQFNKYRQLMRNLTISGPDEFNQMLRAFQGGFTHANAWYVGKTMENVASYDFTSSYPAVMLSEKFPMSSAEYFPKPDSTTFSTSVDSYCCIFDVHFTGLKSTYINEHYLSSSKCWDLQNAVRDNGRIVSADSLTTTLTDVDFEIVRHCYSWEKMYVRDLRRYMRGYLPTKFVECILKLYEDKTQLKGVEGREIDYQLAKEMLNSCYGMSVTNPCKDTARYNDGVWEWDPVDIDEALKKYNRNAKRFLFYGWGLWTTAYARRNLWSGIVAIGDDYIYSDTDSVKILNYESHSEYFENYNRKIVEKLKLAMQYHGIDQERVIPKTITGKDKPLGVWDFEGVYSRFKTLGAKRYMTEKDGEISLTVSGLNKKEAVPYMVKKFKDKIFDKFNDGLFIPAEHTGKNIHTYIDFPTDGIVTDYLGNVGEYHEKSSMHMEPTSYDLSLAAEFVAYLMGMEDIEEI